MATDQEIRDAGFKYIPQQQYLQNPFEIPTAPAAPPVSGGITNTNAFAGSGGDGFSVYNADPNTITNMNPNMNALQDARYGNELSYVGRTLPGDSKPLYSTNTAAMKHMGMYPEDYGLDEPAPSKISQLISKGIGFIPGIGTLSKFADFASGLLPVNRRAIMENELGAQGVMVNDIGQIVVGQGGQYNTPEGIMAGYNAYHMDDKTFDKRTDTISETLGKKGISDTDIQGIIDGTVTEEDIESKYGITSTNISKLRNIAIAKNNFTNITDTTDNIVDIKTDTKSNNNGNDGGSATPPGFGTTPEGNYVNQFEGGDPGQGGTTSVGTTSGGTTSGGTKSGGTGYQGSSGSHHYRKGGRAGYFYGGRIGFQGGGSDASSDDFVTSTSTPGPGDTGGEGGTNPSDGSDTQFGGGNNDGENNNPPVTVVNNPVDISTVTKSVGDYEIPYGLEALISDKGKLQAILNADDVLNKNLGLDFTYDQGPYQIGFNADMEGNKNLGLSYNNGNLSAYANTDFNDPSLGIKYSKPFAYGGLASIL